MANVRGWRRGLAMAALAGLALAAHAGAKIEALGALKGEGVYQIEWSRKTEMKREGAAASGSEIAQSATIRIKPEDLKAAAEAEAGEPLIVLASVEKVRLTLRDGESETTIERPKITMEVEPDTDQAHTLTAVAAALGKAEIKLFVVAGQGVARVGGLDEIEAAIGADPSLTAALGVFGYGQLGEALSPIFSACGAAKESDPAKGWTTEESSDLGPAGGLEVKTVWSPAAQAGRFEGATTIAVVAPEGSGAATPTVKITEQKCTGALAWDAASDRLVSFTDSRRLVSTWTLAGMSIGMTIESEMKLTRAAD